MKNENNNPVGQQQDADAALPENHSVRRRLNSRILFGTQTEIVILHNDEEYRLRITSNGKLILTK